MIEYGVLKLFRKKSPSPVHVCKFYSLDEGRQCLKSLLCSARKGDLIVLLGAKTGSLAVLLNPDGELEVVAKTSAPGFNCDALFDEMVKVKGECSRKRN